MPGKSVIRLENSKSQATRYINAIAKAITDNEDRVWCYMYNNAYVLDQIGLKRAIRSGLNAAAKEEIQADLKRK